LSSTFFIFFGSFCLGSSLTLQVDYTKKELKCQAEIGRKIAQNIGIKFVQDASKKCLTFF